jgi:hypothetical protein
MTPNVGLGELVRELRATLETISGGLVDGRPDRLLDAEPRLADIVARLAVLTPEDTTAHRAALLDARAALRRCERLGETIFALNDVYATRRGYGPSGHFATSGRTGQLQARV